MMADAKKLPKRIIVCCDGTWMDNGSGFTKPTWFPYHPYAVLQIPSNVTRIARAFKRRGWDGKHQIIYYHTGVGSGGRGLSSLTGGMFGAGLAEAVRESYSFICTNYVMGDEIILIGFSRGAFTARSVAGLVVSIGLLTREGMNHFFAIYKDNANRHNYDYYDIFPTVPFSDKPTGEGSEREYRDRLVEGGFTRTTTNEGRKIQVHAVGVWDTVGALGIPNLAITAKMGLPHATQEFKFYDTQLHEEIVHAFQALAIDERRGPFGPAVWESAGNAENSDLRQVWFPGTHSSVGGGYEDTQVANMTLAWMMDQLSSIGVAFQDQYIDHIYNESKLYYQRLPEPFSSSITCCPKQPTQWADPVIYEKYKPVRPYGMGKLYESDTGIWRSVGGVERKPGMYRRTNPDTGRETSTGLTKTNERVHSSVRIRLTFKGLGPEDQGRYRPKRFLKNWNATLKPIAVYDPISKNANQKWGNCGHCNEDTEPHVNPEPKKKVGWKGLLGGSYDGSQNGEEGPMDDQDDGMQPAPVDQQAPGGWGGEGSRWVWEYVGKESEAPKERILIEEPLGPYEMRLLELGACPEVTAEVLRRG